MFENALKCKKNTIKCKKYIKSLLNCLNFFFKLLKYNKLKENEWKCWKLFVKSVKMFACDVMNNQNNNKQLSIHLCNTHTYWQVIKIFLQGIKDFWERSGASSVMIARAAEWNLSVFR